MAGDEIEVTLSDDGTLTFDWWCPEVEAIISDLSATGAVKQVVQAHPSIKVLIPFRDRDGNIVRLCG